MIHTNRLLCISDQWMVRKNAKYHHILVHFGNSLADRGDKVGFSTDDLKNPLVLRCSGFQPVFRLSPYYQPEEIPRGNSFKGNFRGIFLHAPFGVGQRKG